MSNRCVDMLAIFSSVKECLPVLVIPLEMVPIIDSLGFALTFTADIHWQVAYCSFAQRKTKTLWYYQGISAKICIFRYFCRF